MAYKVNYGLERAERNRLKQAKKEAKLRDRKAAAESPEDDQPADPNPTEDTSPDPA